MIQLAIDPATKFLGYSIMDTSLTIGYDITKYGLIRIDDIGEASKIEGERCCVCPQMLLSDKLLAAYNNCIDLINQYRPDVIALEDQFISSKTPTAKDVIRVSGLIILAAKQKGIPVVMYPPSEVKKAVAKKGNATKEVVAEAVADIYKNDAYVSMLVFSDKQTKTQDKTDDIYDSVAINLTHRFTRNGKTA